MLVDLPEWENITTATAKEERQMGMEYEFLNDLLENVQT